MIPWQVASKKFFAEKTIHKILKTNSSFSVKQRTTGKKLISLFQQFFADIDKIFHLGGRLGTRLKFNEILGFI